MLNFRDFKRNHMPMFSLYTHIKFPFLLIDMVILTTDWTLLRRKKKFLPGNSLLLSKSVQRKCDLVKNRFYRIKISMKRELLEIKSIISQNKKANKLSF